ncbi:hypothetical protein WN943_011112 [Citrus x changshan-huyou]
MCRKWCQAGRTLSHALGGQLAISTYEERRNMKLIIFIRKAKLIQFMAKLDEVFSSSSSYKRSKELKGVACGFLAVWALTTTSPVIAANLSTTFCIDLMLDEFSCLGFRAAGFCRWKTTFCIGLLLDVAECGVLCLVLDWPLLPIGLTLEY